MSNRFQNGYEEKAASALEEWQAERRLRKVNVTFLARNVSLQAMSPQVMRFAPSPTGFLHLGHVVSALFGQASAGEDGAFYVRIEDIDRVRCTQTNTDALIEDLRWLGLEGSAPMRKQSEHFPDYERVLETLRQRGLLYACTCTRREISAHATHKAPDGSWVYPGTCRHRRLQETLQETINHPVAWRLDMTRALEEIGGEPIWTEIGACAGPGRKKAQAAAFGDVVLGRREEGVSYHLCVTHDDALQKITCVSRGMDLYAATSVHRVLQELMGWPAPLYAHHALLLDATGRKLSKRDGVEGVRHLREAGWTAEQVRRHPLVEAALQKSFGFPEERSAFVTQA